ncbi:hypothetical protein ACFO0N_03960 [Halobium salinum]|uniref:Uncharacterized protein n=1 Tax=Halobium salinum TaxID=1364940 RepID=A0ABD5P8M1_9EURY|nr:hypothetical protein [Halobium salinum]
MTVNTNGGGLSGRFFRWLLVDASRLWVAAYVLGGITLLSLVLAAVGFLTPVPSSPMYFLYSAILGGNLTLITVVISINQLVLSRELGAPGDLRERIEKADAFREDVERITGDAASPVAPADFLLRLHESLAEMAEALSEATRDDGRTDELARKVEELAGDLESDANDVVSTIDSSEGGDGRSASSRVFEVVAATLGTNHAGQLRRIDRLLTSERDALTNRQREHLDALRELLLYIDVARKYFRTVYTEKELSYFSRVMLYVGIPAEVATAAMLAIYGGVEVGILQPNGLLPVVVVTLVAGFAPLAVLFAFVLRLAWVAQRNASVAPFAGGESGYP